jgi:hypothetical protein
MRGLPARLGPGSGDVRRSRYVVVVLWLLPVAVAPGVPLDTIVVKSVHVTALTLDIGRHIWLPGMPARPSAASRTDGT